MQLFTVVTVLAFPLAWATPQFQEIRCDDFTVGESVETSSGSITGHAAAYNPDVSEYLGIPFAQPPVGDLRFAAPLKYNGSSALSGSTFVGFPSFYFSQLICPS
jgi:hypothetical protein